METFPLNYCLALCLVTCPNLGREEPGKYTPGEVSLSHLGHLSHVHAEVRQVGLHLEVLNAGNPRNCFLWELGVARGNYEKMKGYPPMSDADRFPPDKVAMNALEFNRQYRAFLARQKELYPDQNAGLYPEGHSEAFGSHNMIERWRIDQVILECERLHAIWWLASNLDSDNFVVRRSNLNDLKKALGERDYFLGVLPEPVPVERLRRVD